MIEGLFSKTDLVAYLKTNIDEFMFNDRVPLLIAVDKNRFSKIMSTFHKYEKLVSCE